MFPMPTWAWILLAFGVGGLAVLAGLAVLFKVVLPRALKKGLTGMFAAKGLPMAGAAVEVHTIAVAEKPADLGEDEETERVPGRWIRIEATLTPKPNPEGPFTLWEPEELCLMPAPEGKPGFEEVMDASLESHVERLSGESPAAEGDGDEEGDADKIGGPAKVAVTALVPDGVSSVQLQYYGQLLGAPIEAPAAS